MSSDLNYVSEDLVTVGAGQGQGELRPQKTITLPNIETLSRQLCRKILLRPGHVGQRGRKLEELLLPQPHNLNPYRRARWGWCWRRLCRSCWIVASI